MGSPYFGKLFFGLGTFRFRLQGLSYLQFQSCGYPGALQAPAETPPREEDRLRGLLSVDAVRNNWEKYLGKKFGEFFSQFYFSPIFPQLFSTFIHVLLRVVSTLNQYIYSAGNWQRAQTKTGADNRGCLLQ